MTERSIVYGNFTVDRTYPFPASKVFRAWSDPKLKFRWFGAPGEDNTPKEFDFRIGGREYNEGDIGNGQSYTYDLRYQDIVPDQRIVYTYEMTMGGERISVSLASVELKPAGDGTRLILTEYGAYLDGLDTNAQRHEGTVSLIDALGKFLAEMP